MDTFKYTRMGITFVYIGLVLIVLSIFAVPLAAVLRATWLLLLVPALVVASSLLSMIGRILCLSVPKEVGASGLIYAAVALDVSSLFAAVSRMIPGLPNFSGFSGLLSLAAMVFFLIFLKKLAVFINDSESAARASSLLNLGIGLVVVMVAMIVLPLVSLQAFAFSPALLAFVLMVVGFFIYNRLLSGLRKSLA
ncbi:MAG: hypothetical protein K9M08_14900 [Pirellula sp.]|nr:hypothetical protein [Pirellula sp.]